jgi:signal transduction histidine kinase
MNRTRFGRYPVVALGTGLLLVGMQLAEFVLFAAGVFSLYDGYVPGVVSGALFLSLLLYGAFWSGRSPLPRARYRRIGLWTVAGAVVGVALITTINLSMRLLDPFLLVGTVRWGGAFGGVVGIGLGIMEAQVIEQRRTSERLAARQEMLQRERDRLDEFASIISHDLRNPLNVATSRLELARDDCETEHHDHIEDALDRMETIVDDTLTLARHGKHVGETEAADLGTLARQSWQVVSGEGADLTVAESCTVEADPTRVEHVFENLYRNAVEHGGEEVQVRVGVLSEQAGFYVADDGPGIPENKREKVFERGYTSEDEGTGLGLTIVRSIAEAHGWSVAAVQSNDSGARFEFTGVTIH